MAANAVTSFRKTLDDTARETGYNYQILHPNFNAVLGEKKINACWFEPGTIVASIEAEGQVIIIEVAGDLRADVFDEEGGLIRTFEGRLEAIDDEESGFRLISDSDLTALVGKSGLNGYHMEMYEKNVVRAYLEKHPDIYVDAQHPSVARGVVNKALVAQLLGLLKEAEEAEEEYDDADDVPADEPSEDVFAEIEDADEEGDAEDEGEYDDAEEAPAVEPLKEELPPAEEEPEVKKPAKKQAKSQKKAEPAEEKPKAECSGRYDLLPLDIAGELLDGIEEADDDDDSFFEDIEDFKEGDGSLIDAAISFGKAYFTDGVSAVMKLAAIAEADAEENGEDAWKEKDVRYFINEAVRHYLLYLRDGDEEGHTAYTLWNLVCGEWVYNK